MATLSPKEIIAMNRYRLGGIEALRTPTYSVHCSTIDALTRKGYLGPCGPTTKGRKLMEQMDEHTPMQ